MDTPNSVIQACTNSVSALGAVAYLGLAAGFGGAVERRKGAGHEPGGRRREGDTATQAFALHQRRKVVRYLQDARGVDVMVGLLGLAGHRGEKASLDVARVVAQNRNVDVGGGVAGGVDEGGALNPAILIQRFSDTKKGKLFPAQNSRPV